MQLPRTSGLGTYLSLAALVLLCTLPLDELELQDFSKAKTVKVRKGATIRSTSIGW